MLTTFLRRSGFAFGSALLLMMGVGCEARSPSTWFRRSSPATRTRPAPAPKKRWWKPWGGGRTSSVASRKVEPEVRTVEHEQKDNSDFGRAKKLVKRHKFQEAKELLVKVVQKDPKHAEAFRWLGDCYYNLMELEYAIAAYSETRSLDPHNYFALRGKGLAHLHYGHEFWSKYEDALRNSNSSEAHENLGEAHQNYKLSLELLQRCLHVFPGDKDAMYGRAMAAEGASRKLYANAVGLLKKGRKEDAHAWAGNCLQIIDEGIEAAKLRINDHPDLPGPRKLVAGLFFRRAMLRKNFGKPAAAIEDLGKAMTIHKQVFEEIDPGNKHAKQEMDRCKAYLERWQEEIASE